MTGCTGLLPLAHVLQSTLHLHQVKMAASSPVHLHLLVCLFQMDCIADNKPHRIWDSIGSLLGLAAFSLVAWLVLTYRACLR